MVSVGGYLSSCIMNHLADILHIVLKHAIGGGVGDHEARELLLMLLDLPMNGKLSLTEPTYRENSHIILG